MDFAVQALPPYTAPNVPRRDPSARFFALAALMAACNAPPVPERVPTPIVAVSPELADPGPAPPAADCPAGGVATVPLPRTRPEHETLAYWLTRTQEVADLDRPLLDAAAVQALNAAAEHSPNLGFGGRVDLLAPIDVAALASGLQARLAYLRERFTTNKYVRLDGAPLPAELQARYGGEVMPEALAQDMRGPIIGLATGRDSLSEGAGPKAQVPRDSSAEPELRVALDLVPIYCGPQTEPYYSTSRDPDFDRNLCSDGPRPGARADPPPVGRRPRARPHQLRRRLDRPPRRRPVAAALARRGPQLPARPASPRRRRDVDLPLEDGGSQQLPVRRPRPGRPRQARPRARRHPWRRPQRPAADDPRFADSPRPLTRRAVLEEAFAYLGERYGWGDRNGGRDCSRYLMDLFAGLGLALPRHTSDQAIAGSYTVEVPPALPEPERLRCSTSTTAAASCCCTSPATSCSTSAAIRTARRWRSTPSPST
jgi:hypothetical protein